MADLSINLNSTIDQHQDSTGASFGFGQFAQTRYRGQVFVPSTSGNIISIGFNRDKGLVGLKVYFDTATGGNVPSHAVGSELYSFVIPYPSVVDQFYVYDLPIPLAVTSGQKYCFYLAPWDSITNQYVDDYQNAHGVASGFDEMTNTNGTWFNEGGLTWNFATYMGGAEPISITENPSPALLVRPSVSNTVSNTENIALFSPVLSIGVSETVNHTENAVPFISTYFPNVSDSILVSNISVPPGSLTKSLSFNGSTAYVDIALFSSVYINTSMTCWVKVTSIPGNRVAIVTNGRSDIFGGSALGISSDGYFTIESYFNFELKSDNPLKTNVWYHIGCKRDSVWSLFINGIKQQSTTGLGSGTPSGFFTVGAENNVSGPYGFYLPGLVDEVRYYERALTDQEFMDSYGGITVDSTSLKLYWKFNEGSGTTAIDSSGAGHNGTIANATYSSDVPVSVINPTLTFNVAVSDSVAISEIDILILSNTLITVADYVAAQDYRRNLVPNPSFEVDLTGWTDENGARVTTQSYSGSASASFIVSAGFTGLYQSSAMTVQPYTNYTASFYYMLTINSGTTTPHLQINVGNVFGNALLDNTLPVAATWTRWVVTFNTGNNTSIVFRIYNTNDQVTGYFDAFQMEVGTDATYYFDGSITPASWDGTANASTSTLSGGVANLITARNPVINDQILSSENVQMSLVTTRSIGIGNQVFVTENIGIVLEIELNGVGSRTGVIIY